MGIRDWGLGTGANACEMLMYCKLSKRKRKTICFQTTTPVPSPYTPVPNSRRF